MLEYAAAAAKSLQSCPTLCNPIDGGPPGSPVPGILQARTLEWVAISFSIAWKWKMKVKLLSRVRLLATPWTAAHQAPPSMGFSRQEYWSGLPSPSPILEYNVLLIQYDQYCNKTAMWRGNYLATSRGKPEAKEDGGGKDRSSPQSMTRLTHWLSTSSLKNWERDFPGSQWLRLCLAMWRVCVWSLIREVGSHMPQGQKPKT